MFANQRNNNRPYSLGKDLREEYVQHVSKNSCHALTNILAKEPTHLKNFCLFIFSTSVYLGALFIGLNLLGYFKHDVITNINRALEDEPDFPQVTVCNLKYYKCLFNGKPCDPASITQVNNCIEFNPSKNATDYPIPILKSTKPGKQFGLKMKLLEQPGFEIELYIHNQSIGYEKSKVIPTSKNQEVSLSVSRTFLSKLSHPYSNCRGDYTFKLSNQDIFNKTSYPYSQSECFKLCKHQIIFKACQKSEEYERILQYYFSNRSLWRQTLNAIYYECIRLNSSTFIEANKQFDTDGEIKTCESTCPVECQLVSYSLRPYYQPSDHKFAIVNVYYEDFTYLALSEIPKLSVYNLLGVIGGIFSLFMGMSLISCAEFVELMARLFLVFLRHLRYFFRYLFSRQN